MTENIFNPFPRPQNDRACLGPGPIIPMSGSSGNIFGFSFFFQRLVVTSIFLSTAQTTYMLNWGRKKKSNERHCHTHDTDPENETGVGGQAGEIAQWTKVLPLKPDNRSSVSRTHHGILTP